MKIESKNETQSAVNILKLLFCHAYIASFIQKASTIHFMQVT